MSANKLAALQKSKYLEIVFCLWEEGPESAHKEYPAISVKEFQTANAYYDSKRCEGCMCGSCVGLSELSSNLPESPEQLKPLARLAAQLGDQAYKQQATNNISG